MSAPRPKPLLIRLSIKEGHRKATGFLIPVQHPATILDSREGVFTVTGGGVIIATAQKGASVAPAVTGGGVIVVNGLKTGLAAVTVTGGGVISIAGQKGAQVVATVTGGGVTLIDFSKGAAVYDLVVTGGGVVTIEASAPDQESVIEIVFDEGGRAPDDFLDYDLADDDDAVMDLYALTM
jgi:hypothetical protein